MDDISRLVQNIVDELGGKSPEKKEAPKPAPASAAAAPVQNSGLQYPLAKNNADQLKAKSGKAFHEVTYENLMQGSVSGEDLKTNRETLLMQAEIARKAGKTQFAENLERASEMVEIPDDEVLRIYNLLRPNRTDKQTLLDNAKMLREKYHAENLAKLVEDAAEIYAKRGIVKE